MLLSSLYTYKWRYWSKDWHVQVNMNLDGVMVTVNNLVGPSVMYQDVDNSMGHSWSDFRGW